MNEYYHDFAAGFNSWYVVVPLFMLLIFFIGTSKYVLDAKNLRIKRRRKNDCLIRVTAAAMVVASFSLIMMESMAGIVQVVINHLTESSIAWLPVIAGVGLFFSAIVFYHLFLLFGRIGQWTMHGYLIDIVTEKRQEQEESRAQAVSCYKQQLFDAVVQQLNGDVYFVDGEVTYRL